MLEEMVTCLNKDCARSNLTFVQAAVLTKLIRTSQLSHGNAHVNHNTRLLELLDNDFRCLYACISPEGAMNHIELSQKLEPFVGEPNGTLLATMIIDKLASNSKCISFDEFKLAMSTFTE
mmetsp:Transcript_16630/g.20161  ORF Transcript_16630/g.20161 Transcript_16630/m.20161 type:complete len:120 (-) Transcript_16630:84-443(-)